MTAIDDAGRITVTCVPSFAVPVTDAPVIVTVPRALPACTSAVDVPVLVTVAMDGLELVQMIGGGVMLWLLESVAEVVNAIVCDASSPIPFGDTLIVFTPCPGPTYAR